MTKNILTLALSTLLALAIPTAPPAAAKGSVLRSAAARVSTGVGEVAPSRPVISQETAEG